MGYLAQQILNTKTSVFMLSQICCDKITQIHSMLW